MLKEYNEMKKRNQKRKGLIRLSELATRKFIKYFSLFIKQCYRIAWSLKIKSKSPKNPKVARTKYGKIFLLSKCAVWDIKNQNLSNSKKLVDYYVVKE